MVDLQISKSVTTRSTIRLTGADILDMLRRQGLSIPYSAVTRHGEDIMDREVDTDNPIFVTWTVTSEE